MSIAAYLNSNRDAAIQHLSQNVFKLSPEDVEALEADVVGTVPKLLARAFYETQTTLLQQMGRFIPAMVQRQTEAMRKNAEAEDQFYAMWPTIKKAEHGPIVQKYAATYRQMHPTATREQMFEALGPLVMMAAKIPISAPKAPGAPAAPVPATPQPRPQPFVPATGSSGGAASTGQELNPIEAMFLGHET